MIYQPRGEVGGPEGIFNKLTGSQTRSGLCGWPAL